MAIDEKKLIEAAREARKGSYAPYSKINVGAALLLGDGTIVKGANVENASYGLTVCAERNAIFAAVNANGAQKFKAIAVSVLGDLGDKKIPADKLSPCGACRQVMAEFMSDDAVVIVDGAKTYTMGELLPDAFRLD
jgi:homotetrameric cytidine deaminase